MLLITVLNVDGGDRSELVALADVQPAAYDQIGLQRLKSIKERNYNLDLCGFSNESEEVKDPFVLIAEYQKHRAELNTSIDDTISKILEILNQKA